MKDKKTRASHTSNTQYGHGDCYGTGVRQKTGRIVDSSMDIKKKDKKTKPPKRLA